MRLAKNILATLGVAVHKAVDDNCYILAKAVSYSAVLALFPGLIVITNLLLRNNAQRTIDDLAAAIGTVLPPRVRDLLADYLTATEAQTPWVLALAGLAAALFAADMVNSLMEGFRAAYRAPRRRSMWHEYAVATALVFLSVIPLSVANAALILSHQVEAWIARWGVMDPGLLSFVVRAGWWAIALPTVTLILALLYYVAPNRHQTWRGVFPGALLAACLWAPATGLFTLYAQTVPRYREFYGSVSAVIVLLIWTYLSSVIVLLGCEFNAVREGRTESRAT